MAAPTEMTREGMGLAAVPAEGRGLSGWRAVVASVLYGSLLAVSLLTLSDWRIRLATVAVIVLFASRSLWQRRPAGPAPWGREADLGGSRGGGEAEGEREESERGPM